MKINNSKEAAINSKHWENPGAKFYDKIKDSKAALNEAYLVVGDKAGDVSFSASGCKFPHHCINKEGDLVLNVAGVKAAYSRAKQSGMFKGDIKDHLVRHYKELGIYKDSTMANDERINENFEYIESVVGIYENVAVDMFKGFSPEKLLQWMDCIEYDNDDENWKFQSFDQIPITKKGNCHDQSLFASVILTANGYETGQLFFIAVKKDSNVGGMTHTLTWYKVDNKYYWFEHAWESERGIHGPYSNLDELKSDVKKAWKKCNDGYDDILWASSNNAVVGMNLAQYVAAWDIQDETIESLSEWVENAAHGYFVENKKYMTEKSHGDLKYCYRIGFDKNTGEEVAVQFELDPNNITAAGDPRQVAGARNTIYKSGIFSNLSNDDKVIVAASGSKNSSIYSDALDKTKKFIKKLGIIDFITGPAKVVSIFSKNHMKLQSVDLIPLFSTFIETKVKEVKPKLGDMKLNDWMDSNEFKKMVKESSAPSEKYEVGKVGGENKYKTTKLLWDYELFSSYKYTPVLRGFNKSGKGDDPEAALKYIQKSMFVKPTESVSVDDFNEMVSSMINTEFCWGTEITKLSYMGESYTFYERNNTIPLDSYYFDIPFDKFGLINESYESIDGMNYKIYDINDPNVSKYIESDSYTKKYLDYIHKNSGLVCIDIGNDKMIGYIFVGKEKDPGFISTLEVNPEYRRKGFGSMLLDNAIKKCGAKDLVCDKDNTSALELYKKHGFIIVSEVNDKQYYMKLDESISYSNNFDDVLKVVNSLSEEDLHHICSGEFKNSPFVKYREVLKVNGEPAAFIDIYSIPSEMKADEGVVVTATNPSFRGKGYAKVLASRMINHIKDTGIKTLYWETSKGNDASKAIAKSLGFIKSEYINDDDDNYKLILEQVLSEDDLNKAADEWKDKVTDGQFFREILENNDIEDVWFITSDEGVDNCCLKIKGYSKPMRGRSSMISLNKIDDKLCVLVKLHSVGDYGMPGGGWDKKEDPKAAAIRELHEETSTDVRDVARMGILVEYRDDKNKVADWVKEHIPEKDWWYGYYSVIYVGVYNGKWNGHVDEIDKESGFKWEEVDKIKDKLPKEYLDAINGYLDGNNLMESNLKKYVRYGDLPEDGKSKIHRGDAIIGKEEGVSVWNAKEVDGVYFPCMPENPNDDCIADFFYDLLTTNKPIYVVTGDELPERGTDGEPLITNAKIVKEITKDYNYLKSLAKYKESVMIDSLFDEASHGKLKFDFRYAYDIDTGHLLKIVYDLDNIKIDYAGHAYNPGDKGNHLSNNPSANKEVENNISRKGNIDHQSHGQTVLKIVDLVSKNNIAEATTISYLASANIVNIGALEISKDEIDKRVRSGHANVSKIRVGEVDNNKSFKSTAIFKGDNAVNNANNAAMIMKGARGTKVSNLENMYDDNGNLVPVYNIQKNPNAKKFLKYRLKSILQEISSTESAVGDFVDIVRSWNNEKYTEFPDWKYANGNRITLSIINDLIMELSKNNMYKELDVLSKARKDLISQRIIESSDNTIIGFTSGDNIVDNIKQLYLITSSCPNKILIHNLLEEYKLPTHFMEIYESMNMESYEINDGQYIFALESNHRCFPTMELILDSSFINKIKLLQEALDNTQGFGRFAFIESKQYNAEELFNIRPLNEKNIIMINYDNSVYTEADESSEETPTEETQPDDTKEEPVEENPPEIEEPAEEKDIEDIMDEPVEDEPIENEPTEEPSEDKPEEEIKEEPPKKETKPLSIPKQTDAAEKDKNGIRRKKLYIAFIDWCKAYNNKNTFGSVFDKDIFHNVYPFVPHEMRYFYRLANPILCVLSGDLTFFQVSELRALNKNNKKLNELMIFAATEEDLRVFNNKDKKVYRAVEGKDGIELDAVLGSTFDLYIQNMINQGDILNGPIDNEEKEEKNDDMLRDQSDNDSDITP